MSGNAIDRFEFRFQAYIYRSIRLCLQDREGVAASILLCCAIDLLAKLCSGDPNQGFSKRKYVAFLRRYFPRSYNPEEFYEFVRCGLVHNFNMENRYTILCNEDEWAKAAHLRRDPKKNTIVINPFVLFADVHSAFKEYLHDVRHNMEVQKAFFAVHRQFPLQRQQTSWRKMKHFKTQSATDK